MLSDRNVRKINDQIADELHTASSICSDHDEKLEALERVAKLKMLLEPTAQQIDYEALAKELRATIADSVQTETRSHSSIETPLADVFAGLFRR